MWCARVREGVSGGWAERRDSDDEKRQDGDGDHCDKDDTWNNVNGDDDGDDEDDGDVNDDENGLCAYGTVDNRTLSSYPFVR